MRPRTLLLFAFVALLGALAAAFGAAVPQPFAAAAPAEVTLDVSENCNGFKNWPCWTLPGGSPQYAEVVTIASGGKLKFDDKTTPTFATDVVWTSGSPSRCTGVQSTPTNDWEGFCEFEQAGTYKFESANMFHELYGGGVDYRHYEVKVEGPPTPTATTEPATGVTETEATLKGSVNPEGQATSYHFEYGETMAYGSETTVTPASGAGQVSAALKALSPNTTYYFQLVAVYGASKTKVEGGNMAFKTAAPPGAPTASAQPATTVTETEATLNGAVNPDGEATEYFFEYDTRAYIEGEAPHGQSTPKATLQASGGNQGVSGTLKGLTPGTEYHFRVVAKNSLGGPIDGKDVKFTTLSPPSKEPTKEPSPTSPPTGGTPTSTTTTPQVTPTRTVQEKATKPLTRAQKLSRALKQCRKQPKKKRAKCEAKAKKLYGPKHKGRKK